MLAASEAVRLGKLKELIQLAKSILRNKNNSSGAKVRFIQWRDVGAKAPTPKSAYETPLTTDPSLSLHLLVGRRRRQEKHKSPGSAVFGRDTLRRRFA